MGKKESKSFKNQLKAGFMAGALSMAIGASSVFAGNNINEINQSNARIEQESNESMSEQQEFIEKISKYAIEAGKKYHIYPSVIIAQASFESGFGKNQYNNNLFSLKAISETSEYWDGESVTVPVSTGNYGQPNNSFKVYKTLEDAIYDYARTIETHDCYKPAIEAYDNGKGAKAQLKAIANGGYSATPNYAEKIYENIIKEYNLEKYDGCLKENGIEK